MVLSFGFRNWCAAGAILALGLSGCRNATAASDAAVAPATPRRPLEEPRVSGAFEPYPGVRLLCSEHTSGSGMHIQWYVYASQRTPEDLVGFYRQRHPEASSDAAVELVVRGPNRAVLTVYPREGYARRPHCAQEPAANERALILLSQATGGR